MPPTAMALVATLKDPFVWSQLVLMGGVPHAVEQITVFISKLLSMLEGLLAGSLSPFTTWAMGCTKPTTTQEQPSALKLPTSKPDLEVAARAAEHLSILRGALKISPCQVAQIQTLALLEPPLFLSLCLNKLADVSMQKKHQKHWKKPSIHALRTERTLFKYVLMQESNNSNGVLS